MQSLFVTLTASIRLTVNKRYEAVVESDDRSRE